MALLAPVAWLLLLGLLLSLPPVQEKVADLALGAIQRRTGNRMTLGGLYFRPFDRLWLDDVLVSDRRGDTLFYAERMAARFDLFRLANRQLLLRRIELSDWTLHVSKDSMAGDFNFQFLIDAFASPEADTTAAAMSVVVRNLRLKRGRVHFDIFTEPALADSLFDLNHLSLTEFDSDISLRLPRRGELDVRLHELSFVEKSGLRVNQLQGRLQSSSGRWRWSDVRLRLPRSRIAVEEGEYGSDGFRLVWEDTEICPAELRMFYPPLAACDESLRLSGELSGEGLAVDLSRWEMAYGNHMKGRLHASLADRSRWAESPVRLTIDTLSVDDWLTDRLFPLQKPYRLGGLQLSGILQGSLPRLDLALTTGSDWGELRLEGTAGYDLRHGEALWDLSLQSAAFDLGTYMQDSLFGWLSLRLRSEGKFRPAGPVDINASARIDRLDIRGYACRQLGAEVIYTGDSLRLDLQGDDVNMPVGLHATARLGSHPRLAVDLDLGAGVRLDSLGLLPQCPEALLRGHMRARMEGFDVERMRAEVEMDSLSLITHKGAFVEPRLRLVYEAKEAGDKRFSLRSDLVSARAEGSFSYAGLRASAGERFPVLFPSDRPRRQRQERREESFDFRMGMNRVNALSDLLDLPWQIPDSVLVMGRYGDDGESIRLAASAFARLAGRDTLQVSLLLTGRDNRLAVNLNGDNRSSDYDADGSINAELEFLPRAGGGVPDIHIRLLPAVWVVNETAFNFQPAAVEITEGRYVLHDLRLDHAGDPDEYLRLDGVVAESETDSLVLDISQFQLSTLLGAVKTDLPLAGVAGGRMTARSLLAKPRVSTEDFSIRQIIFDSQLVGDLQVNGAWDGGLSVDATLGREGRTPSALKASLFPETDSLWLQARIRDIELQWFQKMLSEDFYGLSGSLGMDVNVAGRLSKLSMDGVVRADGVQVGMVALNTLYSLTDSVSFDSETIDLDRLTVLDPNLHTLVAMGRINHQGFTRLTPDVDLMLNDFQILGNERQVERLFYGNLRVNGLLTVQQSGREWLIAGDVTHSNHARLTVNLPSSASTAERYNHMITYVNAEQESAGPVSRPTERDREERALRLPLKISTSLWFDPGLTMGAVFNPLAGDAAHVSGNGRIKFNYDLSTSAMNLLGSYEIASGNVSLSLAKITKKTFAVQNGGKLVFHGNPMETTFNLTALYNLRADLKTLDPSFSNLGIVNTKVPVSCSLTATGNINRMTLEYDILLPTEPEDIQRKVDGLLYSDNMKIKQIAYLLALGSFMPASSDSPDLSSPTLINSLASLTSGGLNKLLAGVLSDKWSINTDVQMGDAGLSDMAINVSGSMLDDRLTVNGTVGYHDNAGRTNNFTGDFDVEYRLIPSGDLVLKASNVTNNQYYEQAATTQSVGVVYKRKARTFRRLFDKFKKKNEEQ